MLSTTPKPSIYTVGGTVQAGGGVYIPRRADEKLLELCRQGAFAYVLSTRQVGKSSLMVRTSEHLAQEGINSVVIDLTQIGVQVTAESWYLGLLAAMEDQLMLATDVVEWWERNRHFGFTQRLNLFFEEVLLSEVTSRVVIFVDEIDTTLSLDFTDDFYAAIRYLYNARAQNAELKRLSFVLVGVATPGDLIRDEQRTPFNIGERVELTDWTFEEALPLADGLGLPPDHARAVLGWALKWTGGHPYLTQRLCRLITERGQGRWTEADVDRLVGTSFLGTAGEQDNNIQFVRDMLLRQTPAQVEPGEVLLTYWNVRSGRRPVHDDEQSVVKAHLKLSGIVCRDNGVLRVRNRIYREVFDNGWIKEHLPPTWAKLQLQRLRRVAVAGLSVLAVLTTVLAVLAMVAATEARQQRRIAEDAATEAREQKQNAERQRELAEQQRAEADKQRALAEGGRQEALQQKQIAEVAMRKEEAARNQVEKERQTAEVQRRIAEQRSKEAGEQRLRATAEAERAKEQAELAVRSEYAARSAQQQLEESLKREVQARQEAEFLYKVAEESRKELEKVRAAEKVIEKKREMLSGLYIQVYDLQNSGKSQDAVQKFNEIRNTYREVGDTSGEVSTLINIGDLYGKIAGGSLFSNPRRDEGYAEAIKSYKEAIEVNRKVGDLSREAAAYEKIAKIYDEILPDTKEHVQASIDNYLSALAAYNAANDNAGKIKVLRSLGNVYNDENKNVKDLPKSIGYYRRALELTSPEDREQIADLNETLAELYNDSGDKTGAAANQRRAFEAYLDAGRRGPANAALRAIGKYLTVGTAGGTAQTYYVGMLNEYSSTKRAIGEGLVSLLLGEMLQQERGQEQKALEYLNRALGVFKGKDPLGEADTLTQIGAVYSKISGKKSEALRNLNEAVRIYREIPNRSGEIRAQRLIRGLGDDKN